MDAFSNIVVLGHDDILLTTRRLVLEHAGFQVTAAGSITSAVSSATQAHFDLLLLCHTLSSAECVAAVMAMKRIQPGIKTLVVTTSGRGTQGPWATVEALEGPQRLIAAAHSAIVTG